MGYRHPFTVQVFAGVDYERILRAAEEEADVVIWDGGNNDTPFFRPGGQLVAWWGLPGRGDQVSGTCVRTG